MPTPIHKFLKPKPMPVENPTLVQRGLDEQGLPVMRLCQEQFNFKAHTGSFTANPVIAPLPGMTDFDAPSVSEDLASKGWFRPTMDTLTRCDNYALSTIYKPMPPQTKKNWDKTSDTEKALTQAYLHGEPGVKPTRFLENNDLSYINAPSGLHEHIQTVDTADRATCMAILKTGPDGSVLFERPREDTLARLPGAKLNTAYQKAAEKTAKDSGLSLDDAKAQVDSERKASVENYVLYGRTGRDALHLACDIRHKLQSPAVQAAKPEDRQETALMQLALSTDEQQRDALRSNWELTAGPNLTLDNWRQYYGLPARDTGLYPAFDIRTIPGLPDQPPHRGAIIPPTMKAFPEHGMSKAVTPEQMAAISRMPVTQSVVRGRDVSDLPDVDEPEDNSPTMTF